MELLATIIILAIILAIAIPSIGNLASSIRKNHLKNKIKNIEIAASKYAFDTKETSVFVDKLVTEGYMDSDDEDGNVFNDTDHSKLNCYIVKMTKVGDHYNAIFQDNNSYEHNGKCDESILKDTNKELTIDVIQNGVKIVNYDDWLGGSNITLKATSNNIDIDCIKNTCSWHSTSGHSNNGSELTINYNDLLVASKIDYTFELSKINEDNTVTRYNSNISLKIDNELPVIYENETKINEENKLEIKASDNNGSGIVGYFVELNGSICSSDMSYSSENIFDVTNGNYLICVKDKVGNIASLKITI